MDVLQKISTKFTAAVPEIRLLLVPPKYHTQKFFKVKKLWYHTASRDSGSQQIVMDSLTAIVVYNNTQEVRVHQELPDTFQQGEKTWGGTSTPYLLEDNRPILSSFKSSSNSPLGFLDLALEIRRMIYEEYFSVSEPISFQSADSSSLALHIDKNYGLHTALLRANKQIHSEAAPYLYSIPEFNFVGIQPTQRLPTTDAAFAYFLRQIGTTNAKLLRNLAINFPSFNPLYSFLSRQVCKADEDSVGILKQIHDQCAGLVTLRMALHVLHALAKAFTDPDSLKSEMTAIGWLNEQLQAMPFLRRIVVHIQVLQKERFYECRGWKKRSRELGWKFEVMDYKHTGNEEDDNGRYIKAAVDVANMERRSRIMRRGYYIKRKTTVGEYEVDYELSYRVACRKVEEGLLQSA